MKGWIGVDFDGTLATYDRWRGPEHTGQPILPMVHRVRRWIGLGSEVRIFTARVWPIAYMGAEPVTNVEVLPFGGPSSRLTEATQAAHAVRIWCLEQFGVILPITCVKDMGMIELWDDRAVQVIANTGEPVGHSTRGLV